MATSPPIASAPAPPPHWKAIACDADDEYAPAGLQSAALARPGFRVVASDGAAPSVRVLDTEGTVVFEAQDETHHVVRACFLDLTGDGRPELWLDSTTGGAHCCSRESLVGVRDGRWRELAGIEMGDGGVAAIADRDRDGIREMVLDFVDHYPTTELGWGYDCSVWRRAVVTYHDGAFREMNARFPAVFSDVMEGERQALRAPRMNAQQRECNALRLYVNALGAGNARESARFAREHLDERERALFERALPLAEKLVREPDFVVSP